MRRFGGTAAWLRGDATQPDEFPSLRDTTYSSPLVKKEDPYGIIPPSETAPNGVPKAAGGAAGVVVKTRGIPVISANGGGAKYDGAEKVEYGLEYHKLGSATGYSKCVGAPVPTAANTRGGEIGGGGGGSSLIAVGIRGGKLS